MYKGITLGRYVGADQRNTSSILAGLIKRWWRGGGIDRKLSGDARYYLAWGGLSLEVSESLVSTGGMVYVLLFVCMV